MNSNLSLVVLCSKRVGSVSATLMAIMYSVTLFQTQLNSFTLNLRRTGRAVSAEDLSATMTH